MCGLQTHCFCLSCTFMALHALLGERLQGGAQEAIVACPPPSTSTLHGLVTPSPCSSLGAEVAHVGHPAWLQQTRWGACPVVFRMEKKPGGYKVPAASDQRCPSPGSERSPAAQAVFPSDGDLGFLPQPCPARFHSLLPSLPCLRLFPSHRFTECLSF